MLHFEIDKAAHFSVMDELVGLNSAQIEAHGLHVGLPEGLMGNSEVCKCWHFPE